MLHTRRTALTGLSTVLALGGAPLVPMRSALAAEEDAARLARLVPCHFLPGDVGKPFVLGAGVPAGAGEGASLPELAARVSGACRST